MSGWVVCLAFTLDMARAWNEKNEPREVTRYNSINKVSPWACEKGKPWRWGRGGGRTRNICNKPMHE